MRLNWGMLLLLIVLSSSLAFASHNRFDPFVDLNSIDWFDRGLYFEYFPVLPCVDLEEFYAYADSDPYDRYDREYIERYADRLGFDDYNRLARQHSGENFRDLDRLDDFHCSNRGEYNRFADQDRFDRYDRDDYFRLFGYDDEEQYERITRHYPYEIYPDTSTPYGREDGYGGYASTVRPGSYYGQRTSITRTQNSNPDFTPVALSERHPGIPWYYGAIDILSW